MSKLAIAISLALVVALGLWLRTGSENGSGDGVGYLGLVLTPLAVLVPLVGFNWWLQDRHRPSFGFERPPISQVTLGSIGLTAATFVVINSLWIAFRFFGTGVSVLLLGIVGAIAAAVVVPGLLKPAGLNPMSAADMAPFRAVADWAQIRCEFLLDVPTGGPNARATSRAGKRIVAISPELLDKPAELQSLVVAHEVAHLKLSHLTKLRALTAVHWGTLVVIGWLIARLLGENRLDESWIYPLLAAGYLGAWALTLPAVAFFRRHFERQADALSYELLGNVPTSLGRMLHATQFANLEPDIVQKLISNHPPVAERLELISRRIQTL